MGLQVDVEVIVRQLDGVPLVHQREIALTFNADTSRVEDEVPLVLAELRRIFERTEEVADRRLTDWSVAIRKSLDKQEQIQREARAAVERAQEDEPPEG